jgi:hypothetical protein
VVLVDTIERLRAGWGQPVLMLAASDPWMDRAVNLYADGIAAILREPATVDGGGGGVVDLARLDRYARRFLTIAHQAELLGRTGGLNARSMTAAAICRLADRLAAAGETARSAVR